MTINRTYLLGLWWKFTWLMKVEHSMLLPVNALIESYFTIPTVSFTGASTTFRLTCQTVVKLNKSVLFPLVFTGWKTQPSSHCPTTSEETARESLLVCDASFLS